MLCLGDFINMINLNWSDFIIVPDDFQSEPSATFELEPNDYLQFSKNNIKINDIQNCIEGISNVKRAIECQIDLLISAFGFNYREFSRRGSYPYLKKFINQYYKEECYEGLTDKLKLLNIFGLAPISIIATIRRLRNIVEHEYKEIPYEEVKRSVEIAELFINSSNSKFMRSPLFIHFGNAFKKECKLFTYSYLEAPYIELRYNADCSTDLVQIKCVLSNQENSTSNLMIKLRPEDSHYIEIIYCILNKEYMFIPKIFEVELPNLNLIKYLEYV